MENIEQLVYNIQKELEELKSWVYRAVINLQKQIDEIKEKTKEGELFGK